METCTMSIGLNVTSHERHFFDFCDKSSNCTSYPNLSPETVNCYNTTCKERVKSLSKILDCFLKKTSSKYEDFDI